METLNHIRKHGSVRVIKRLSVFPVQQILPILSPDMELNGIKLSPRSRDRILCFMHKGIICAGCGQEATYFALEEVESDHFSGVTLNLYGEGDLYFTKDHIKPKKLGGLNVLDNYQTMCWPCNQKKGAQWM